MTTNPGPETAERNPPPQIEVIGPPPSVENSPSDQAAGQSTALTTSFKSFFTRKGHGSDDPHRPRDLEEGRDPTVAAVHEPPAEIEAGGAKPPSVVVSEVTFDFLGKFLVLTGDHWRSIERRGEA
jgi:hypothetical protein